MSLEETETIGWAEPGQSLECAIDSEAFGPQLESEVTLRLNIEEVLEEFERRRVLVASANEVLDSQTALDDQARSSLLHPTYLIEEAMAGGDGHGSWPDEIRPLVREPVSVHVDGELKRSVFVDNVGVSVGELVDLVRGQLTLTQLVAVFRAVGDLFENLHDEGWVHLGLTPWNVRVFDETTSDGFPRFVFTESSEEGTASDTTAPEQEASAGSEDESTESSVHDSGDNAFEAGGQRTVVELNPLGETDEPDGQTDDQAEASSDAPPPEDAAEQPSAGTDEGDSSFELADGDQSGDVTLPPEELLTGDTAPVSTEEQGCELEAILDGIDRLYPAGEIDDEIAVTPGFSAPELLSGMGSEDGESADVFSLGMFLYFLVAGAVPPASVYTRYAPAIPARNFRPDFPPGLQAVISRATRPQPDDRYASVQVMMESFEDAVDAMFRRRGVGPETAPTADLASDTHVGIAKKERNPTNQDSVFSATSDDEKFALIVVADGVSTASYGSGDLASGALTDAAREVWEEILPVYLMDEPLQPAGVIQNILSEANETIVDYVNEHHTPFRGSPHEVMGSTALVALLVDGVVTLASLGDSRAYLQRGAGIEQITIDHNLWTLSILEGVEADRALAMPHGDALARCLGTFTVEEGELEPVEPEPDLFQFKVAQGDTLLLTTDGLVDFAGTNQLVAEDNILSILLSEPDPALACLEAILLANRGGGGDNIGLSIARFY